MVPNPLPRWDFYGRRDELAKLQAILGRERWFFLKITGRRRIGKTSLIQQALSPAQRDRVLYIQIPDSDPAGVVSAARDFMSMFGVHDALPVDLRSLATRIGSLCESGWIVALDEFQYFNRKVLYEFTSQLQSEVDRLSQRAEEVPGGLIVLGSLHTEMSALLEDRQAPLYNRATDVLHLDHLDIASVLEILDVHADTTPERLLFLWNLFEGVPKFYRDCYEQAVLSGTRAELLETMFFSSSSPLRTEADHWFLEELRGRYDLLLKFIARHPGCSNADVLAHAKMVEPDSEKQVGGYLKVLDERYRMVERLQPVFAQSSARSGRFYIRDNFLRSWLAALAVPVASIHFRPLADLVRDADQKLAESEGHGLERLAVTLYHERSRKGLGDFPLSDAVRGWWDRKDTEIDLVALDETRQRLRLGTCKRSASKLASHLVQFDGHVARFLDAKPSLKSWTLEKVAIAPRISGAERANLQRAGYLPQDLADLTEGLLR
jgi:AAA+ ATPase superfamily predicted ATPase